MVEDVREEGSVGATVGVQKTEQIRLVRRRSAKACPLARSMTVQRDTRVHGMALWHTVATRKCASHVVFDVRKTTFAN